MNSRRGTIREHAGHKGLDSAKHVVLRACRRERISPLKVEALANRLAQELALIVDEELQLILGGIDPEEFGGNFLR